MASVENLVYKDHLYIESLARDADMPIERVSEIYRIERTQLEKIAKVKTFVPVLACKRARDKLREMKELERVPS